jgi:hypothetical protein
VRRLRVVQLGERRAVVEEGNVGDAVDLLGEVAHTHQVVCQPTNAAEWRRRPCSGREVMTSAVTQQTQRTSVRAPVASGCASMSEGASGRGGAIARSRHGHIQPGVRFTAATTELPSVAVVLSGTACAEREGQWDGRQGGQVQCRDRQRSMIAQADHDLAPRHRPHRASSSSPARRAAIHRPLREQLTAAS